MASEPVDNDVLYDSTRGWNAVGGLHEDNAARQLNLYISPEGTVHRLRIETTDEDLLSKFGGSLECLLPLTVDMLRGHVQTCREAWRTAVIDRKGLCLDVHQQTSLDFVFQRHWNFSNSRSHLQKVMRPLAEAGSQLFQAIFEPDEDDDASDVTTRRHIFDVLYHHATNRSLWLKITSSRFFAPWNMIYSQNPHGPGAIDETGFWGYQHIIEHVPRDSGANAQELNEPVGEAPLKLGMNIDQTIDATFNVPCIGPVQDQLDNYSPSRLLRTQRDNMATLGNALQNAPDDHILYFCCHAEQEGDGVMVNRQGRMRLEDPPPDGWFSPDKVRNWLLNTAFQHHPVVFLNACGGGQANSTFYESFSRVFLAKGASAVIGPQTDLPAIFGGEFAKQFFNRFFTGGCENKIAKILADLRRTFFDEYHNPLGLLYSLYRGGDTYLRKPIPTESTP